MTAEISKAFYVHCPDCHYEEFDFHKKDAKRHADTHDCVKFLTRQWNYSHQAIRGRFKIAVTRAASPASPPGETR